MIRSILENDEWCLTGEEELIAHQRARTKRAKSSEHGKKGVSSEGCSSRLAFLPTAAVTAQSLMGSRGHAANPQRNPLVFIKYSNHISSANAEATSGWIPRERQEEVLYPLQHFLSASSSCAWPGCQICGL